MGKRKRIWNRSRRQAGSKACGLSAPAALRQGDSRQPSERCYELSHQRWPGWRQHRRRM